MVPSVKCCTKCKAEKPREEFGKAKVTRDGLNSWCRQCYSDQYHKNREHILAQTKVRYQNSKPSKKAYDIEYNKKNRAVVSENKRILKIATRYGLTAQQYEQMFVEQNQSCYLCKTHQSAMRTKLAVDHCHATGVVRGLLCNKCNMALGAFGDNISVMEDAIKYLKRFGK